jgi:hypothetical protein
MQTQSGPVEVLELRRLLYELKDQRSDICIRFRLIGEMWQPSFSRVIKLIESGVVLLNEENNLAVSIKDLREVVQFEIDARYQNFHPHNHYDLEPSMNVSERHLNLGRS